MNKFILTTVASLATLLSIAQSYPNSSSLTIETIMQGPDFVGQLPSNLTWDHATGELWFQKKKDMNSADLWYAVSPKGEMRKCDSSAVPVDRIWRMDGRRFYLRQGVLFELDKKGNSIELLDIEGGVRTIDEADNGLILYTTEKVYHYAIAGQLKTILSVQKDRAERGEKNDPYLERQQEELFKVVNDREKRSESGKEAREARKLTKTPSWDYPSNLSVINVSITPDLSTAYVTLVERPNNEATQYMEWVNAEGEATMKRARPKVGREDAEYMLYHIDLKADSTQANKVDLSTLPGRNEFPAYYKDYGRDTGNYSGKIQLMGPWFSEDGKALYTAKAMNNKDRWIFYLPLGANEYKLVDHQHDDAWIGGPGITGWNMVPGPMGWVGNDQVYYTSEKTGWEHLYVENINTGAARALTSGEYEVHSVELSEDDDLFFVGCNKTDRGNHDFYHVDLSGDMTPVLTGNGQHEVTVSPDEKWLAIRYSNWNQPWEVHIAPNKSGTEMTRKTFSTTPEFKTYQWRKPEMVQIPTKAGPLHGRLYKPENGKANGAAVIFVHGAGYLQNAHNGWSGYYREYMFHNFLVDNGYTVIDLDYRASKGYGREWRTAIYRHMGGADMDDQLIGKNYLVENHGIDADRVGIYGGSYGGFISLMGLLTHQGEFAAGAALRSVTDWAHYNHEYTSNILNTPELDSVAYRRSSPIYFADNLQDPLVMLHGMVDDNVQYHDIIRLSQRFIELGKDDWELASYPVEAHGFVEPSSWTDEYKRIYRIMWENLGPKLEAGN